MSPVPLQRRMATASPLQLPLSALLVLLLLLLLSPPFISGAQHEDLAGAVNVSDSFIATWAVANAEDGFCLDSASSNASVDVLINSSLAPLHSRAMLNWSTPLYSKPIQRFAIDDSPMAYVWVWLVKLLVQEVLWTNRISSMLTPSTSTTDRTPTRGCPHSIWRSTCPVYTSLRGCWTTTPTSSSICGGLSTLTPPHRPRGTAH